MHEGGGLFIFSKHASEGGIELIVLACLSNKPHWLCRFLAYKNQWVIKKWYQVISKARGEKGAKLEKSFSQLWVVKNVNNLGFDTRETGFGEIGGGGQGGLFPGRLRRDISHWMQCCLHLQTLWNSDELYDGLKALYVQTTIMLEVRVQSWQSSLSTSRHGIPVPKDI